MTPTELRALVAEVQRRKCELDNVEVKKARGGIPRRLYETLSAFANRPGGGIIILGVDESGGFAVKGVGDAQRLQEDVSHLANADMEPPLRPRFVFDEIDGETVVAVEIDEIRPAEKPCFYKNAGLPKGAYLRVGNTNRQMTEYEVFGFLGSRGQPRHDEELVQDATMDDLDSKLLDNYLSRMRHGRPRADYLHGSPEDIFVRLRVCGRHDGVVRPTLAGLVMFGKYPQEFFPQLIVTFVHCYGKTEEESTPRGERFLDNQSFEGSIPRMLEEAARHVIGAMRKASLIDGLFRRDVLEYPQEAVREALANAVAHRDYSHYVRGSPIGIRMFADRLEVQSPGGLYGNVTVDNIEEEHSTRNARLMRMMEDMQVVENRGSGIKAMIHALRQANLEPPAFDDRRSSFNVTLRNHTLMNPEAIAWLNQFADRLLNDRQRLTLVYLRQHTMITNPDYRRLNRVDPTLAGQELRGLTEQDLVEQEGFGRWTTYRLKVSRELPALPAPLTKEDLIVDHVRQHGAITNAQCRDLLKVEAHQVYYLLQRLCEGARLKPEGKGKWRRYILP